MYDVRRVGTSGAAIVVFDDFHPAADHLRDMAIRSRYRRLSPHYPGIQAPTDPRHLGPVQGRVLSAMRDVFALDQARLVQCSFSLVTTRPEDLAAIQRLPHVDTTDPRRLALLHYLSDECGGTAFYRHRATGLEFVTADDFEGYKRILDEEGAPKSGYMNGSDDRFEEVGRVAARYNRAILYRSALLHSGIISRSRALSKNPETGRLTVNSFLQCESLEE